MPHLCQAPVSRRTPLWLLALLALGLASAGQAQDLPRVVIRTAMGNIEVEIDSIHAPITSANFLRYEDLGFYRFGLFHRTVRADNQPNDKVKIAVIQAGLDSLRVKSFPPIKLERTKVTHLSHKDGTISMARDGPDTGASDFFICIGDQPALDFGGKRNPDGQGFAAFGRVVLGMDVVHRIHMAPAHGQTLQPPVPIYSITRKTPGADGGLVATPPSVRDTSSLDSVAGEATGAAPNDTAPSDTAQGDTAPPDRTSGDTASGRG
jgi:peptidyl-prolyl cis-trans isomerase A (cyclophilin A)